MIQGEAGLRAKPAASGLTSPATKEMPKRLWGDAPDDPGRARLRRQARGVRAKKPRHKGDAEAVWSEATDDPGRGRLARRARGASGLTSPTTSEMPKRFGA